MKIFKGCAIALLIIALLIGAGTAWFMKERAVYEIRALPYIEEQFPRIATWDPEILWELYSPSVQEAVRRAEHDRIFSVFGRLGALESYSTPAFLSVNSSTTLELGAVTFVTYSFTAEFSNGTAEVTMQLLDDGDKISIYSLNIDSPIFRDVEADEGNQTAAD